MTIRDKIKPFVIVDYTDGAVLQLYSVEDYKQEIFDTRKHDGFTGNGHDWTDLAKLFIAEEMPDISDEICFDSDAGMFMVYADDPLILEALAVNFKAALDNDDYIYPMFRRLGADKAAVSKKEKTPKTHSIFAGALVHNSEGKILLVDVKGKGWTIPQGTVGSGEELTDAVKRIVFEKSGMGVNADTIAQVTQDTENDAICFDYSCTYVCGHFIRTDEIINAAWFTEKEAAEIIKPEDRARI